MVSHSGKTLTTIKDLFEKEVLLSFEQLSAKFKLPQNNLFRYLQIRSIVQIHAVPGFSSCPTPVEQVLLDNRSKTSLIERCYEALLKGTKVNNEETLAILGARCRAVN